MTRILFYLPNVTPWWFDHMIAPLLRALAGTAELHVMVPPLWRSTGITADQLAPFGDAHGIVWHILDGDDHPEIRENGTANAELCDLVRTIDADVTLCRCADPEVIHAFPGTVRFIMEGAAHPIANGACQVTFPTRLFEHGAMPPLTAAQAARLDALFAGIWDHFEAGLRGQRVLSWRIAAGVPADRPVVAVPLEYAFEDSFTARHQHFPDNVALVDAVDAAFGPDVFIAFTNHPLNDIYGDSKAAEARIAALGAGRAALVPGAGEVRATELVARDCQAAVVDLTKSYLAYAYWGVPIARPTPLATAPWLNAARDLDAFAAALAAGTAPAPGIEDVRRWFAHHVANTALDVSNRRLAAAHVLDHIRRPFNPARWEANIDQFSAQLRRAETRRRRLAA